MVSKKDYDSENESMIETKDGFKFAQRPLILYARKYVIAIGEFQHYSIENFSVDGFQMFKNVIVVSFL